MSSIKNRLIRLERECGVNTKKICLISLGNLFGAGSEEEQLQSWRQRHPGEEPSEISKVSLVGFSEQKP